MSAWTITPLARRGIAITAVAAVLSGGLVAAWQSQLSATYAAVAAIPVRAEPSGADLRFGLVPTEANLDSMLRARPAHAGRSPEFVDTDREGIFDKFKPAQRRIEVTAYGSTPREASRNAMYYASRWVNSRGQRLTSREEALDAKVAHAAFEEPRLIRVDSSPTSPRPLRDGGATAAAILLLALGVASVPSMRGCPRARGLRPRSAATEP